MFQNLQISHADEIHILGTGGILQNARILKLYMWHVHENKRTRIFFPPPVLSFRSYAPFSTMYEQPCEQNI